MFETLIWLVPAAVLAAGVWRPRAGLLVLTAALPLFGTPPGGPYLAALDVAALAAVATAWRAGSPPRSRLDRPILAFVVVSLASMVPVAYHPPSWQPQILLDLLRVFPNVETHSALYTWRAATNLILGWVLYLAVRRAFHGRSFRPLGIAMAVGVVPTLLLGLASHAGLVELWAYRPIGGTLWDPRLHSLFFHSGWLAEYLVLATPVVVVALLGAKAPSRAAAPVLVVLTLAALVLTLQRGAWLTAAAQLVLLLVLFQRGALERDRRGLRRTAAAAGMVALLSLLALTVRPGVVESVRERLRVDQSVHGRWAVWQDSMAMIEERPVLGWGLGGFLPARLERDQGHAAETSLWLTTHNQYLMIGAERGLLGLLAFGWLAWALAGCLRAQLRSEDAEKRRMARGLAVAFVGFAVYGLVQYLFFLKMIEWLFWILAGAAAALAPEAQPQRSDRVAEGLALVALLLIPWRGVGTPPIEMPTDRSFGFHSQEVSDGHDFSWTEGHAARRLAWDGEVLVLELANGHPRAGERPLEVTIRLDNRVAARVTVRGGWKEHRLVLGAPNRESIVLSLEVRPVFRPFSDLLRYPKLERSRDIRLLGVAVGPIRWEEG